MAVWSIVLLSELDGCLRIDAEFYQPTYIEERRKLSSLPCRRLGEIAFVTDGQHGYHVVDEESGIKHITARCVVNYAIDTGKAEGLGLETHLKNPRSALEEGDVILSTAGTIGNPGVVTVDVLPANIDQDVARIKIHDQQRYSPWYIAVFLNSELGRLQTHFQSTGQVQKHLSLGAVRDLLIPELPQEEIVKTVTDACDLQRKSKSLYAEAEALLLHELRLDTLDLSHQLTYERDFSETVEPQRWDADYFQPKYVENVARIRRMAHNRLGDIADFSNGATPLGADYLDEGIPFLRIQNVNANRLELNDVVYISEEIHQNALKRSQLEPGDVLITITGRIGTAAVIPPDLPAANMNQHSVRLRLHNGQTNPYYLAAFLNSLPGLLQTEREAYGTTREALPYSCLKRVLIPKAPQALQQAIEDTIHAAEAARQDARNLLETAKKRVEDMILARE